MNQEHDYFEDVRTELDRIGKKPADLARFLDITPDKVSKSLAGKRKWTVHEWALLTTFFKKYRKKAIHSESDIQNAHFDSKEQPRRGILSVTSNATVALRPIPELDMRLGGATGGAVQHFFDPDSEHVDINSVDVRLEWQVPADWVSTVPAPGEKRLFIMPVLGRSMSPEFNPGDRVLVNAADRTPSPAGAFVVWDGLSLVIKLVNYVPHSSPPRVQLISRDHDIPVYERTLDEAYIQGRVVGKWDWH